MAKQQGIHQLRGKVGGMKYYGMKGVEGGLVQSINEGMSNRVKTGAEYANTRRNNREFGMAASTAGAAIKSLSQRWRYLLVPFATSHLAKSFLRIAQATPNVKWGERYTTPSFLQAYYAMGMQALVKNDISDFGNLSCTVTITDGGATLNLNGENLHNEKAEAAGCTGVRCSFVEGSIIPSSGGSSTVMALPAKQDTSIITELDIPFGNDVESEIVAPKIAEAIAQSDTSAIGYVVLLPYREIGNEKVVMQEFASAIFATVPEA